MAQNKRGQQKKKDILFKKGTKGKKGGKSYISTYFV